MSQPDPGAPERSHAAYIERYEQRYRGAGAVVFIAPAWVVSEGHVLIEGAHRACALYRLARPSVDADVIEMMPPPGCPDIRSEVRARSLADTSVHRPRDRIR